MPESTKQKIANAHKGMSKSKEHASNISKGKIGKRRCEKAKKAVSEAQSEPVVQLTLDCRFIASFSSQTEAARVLSFKSSTGISKACVGKSETSMGFKWAYFRDWEKSTADEGVEVTKVAIPLNRQP